MKRFYFIVMLLGWVGTASAATPLRSMLSQSTSAGRMVAIGGRNSTGDGGEGSFNVIANDGRTTNTGTVFLMDSGRLAVRQYDGTLNVRWFGAVNDVAVDSTEAFAACFTVASNLNQAVHVPAGTYSISSLNVTKVPLIYGDSGMYGFATTIRHLYGATNDLFISDASVPFRPIIRDMQLVGRREQNLRNLRTITAVNSATEFVVDSAPPDASYSSTVFFYYSDVNGYHYLGSGYVTDISGTTITLSTEQKWFATPTTAAGSLDTDCVVSFGTRVTESSVTVSDPTTAGYCAINVTGSGGYLTLENIRFDDWHCDIRIGVASAIHTTQTFHRGFSLAALYCPMSAGSDHRIGVLEAGGNYAAQTDITDLTVAIDNSEFRNAKYGVFLAGTFIKCNLLQLYHCIRPLNIYYAFPITIDTVDIVSSTCESIVIDNFSRARIGSVMCANVGIHADDTYAAILNVNGDLVCDSVDVSNLAPWTQKAKCLVESLYATAHTSLGRIVDYSGCTILETPVTAFTSQLDNYSYDEDFVSGRGFSGGVWVWKQGTSKYGINMAGDNTENNRLRLQLVASDATAAPIKVFNDGSVRIGSSLNSFPTYKLDVAGSVGVGGAAFSYYNVMPALQGANIPAANPGGTIWMSTTNGGGAESLAALFSTGAKVIYLDNSANITGNNITATGTVTSASSVIGPTNVVTELALKATIASLADYMPNAGTNTFATDLLSAAQAAAEATLAPKANPTFTGTANVESIVVSGTFSADALALPLEEGPVEMVIDGGTGDTNLVSSPVTSMLHKVFTNSFTGTKTLVLSDSPSLTGTTAIEAATIGSGILTNDFALLQVAGNTNVVNLSKLAPACVTNVLASAITFAHATNGVAGELVTKIHKFIVEAASPVALTLPVLWRTNMAQTLPVALTNGVITWMYVRSDGATSDEATQTNCYVSFEYFK